MTATATTLGPGLLSGFAKRPGTPDIPPMPVVGSARVRSLDGLRAIAVTAVIGFHLGVGWLPGGLLGVDMFFVLSGFLITSLLVTERDRIGRISLKGFYSRRARRLLPAMLLVLIVTLVVWRLTADPSRFPGLRGDATATLGYVANWHFAFSGQGYFDQLAPPSPLLHLWSLAVEEQFYLVWPLVVIITLRFGSRRLLLAVAMAGAAASTALISVLSVRGVDANRLYYGTDTRATAVLVGAALALAAPTLVRAAARPRARLAILATGLVAATSLALIMTHTGGQDAWLYRGGFLAVALGVGAVIGASVAAPTSPFARLLACPPLPYLGRISYGLYLWHWPVTLWLTHSRTELSGPALLGVRLAVTLACAMSSWHFLEQPILRGTLRVPAPRITAPAVLAAAAVALVALPPPGVAAATAGVADSHVARLRTHPPAPPGQGPKTLVEGDSVALTLAADLAVAAADPANRQNSFTVLSKARIGCALSVLEPIRWRGRSAPELDSCRTWERDWQADVDAERPAVAVMLTGRWDIMDRMMDGRWVYPGDARYDAYLAHQLDRAIEILASRGAKVVLLTSPYFAPGERPDGTTWPEDDPARVDAFNRLLWDAASRHPDAVRVYDLNAILSPHGRFQRYDDTGRVMLRSDDGIHIPTWDRANRATYATGLAAGNYIAARLFPAIQQWLREGSAGGPAPRGVP